MTELHTRQRFRRRGCTLTENQTQKRFRPKAVLAKNVAIGRLSKTARKRSARTPPPTFLFPSSLVKEQCIRRCAGLPKPRRPAQWPDRLRLQEALGGCRLGDRSIDEPYLSRSSFRVNRGSKKSSRNPVFLVSTTKQGKVYPSQKAHSFLGYTSDGT